ncbi:MAG: diacylglycerol/lipid kinase family protein, partial [Micrococcales bacterium]
MRAAVERTLLESKVSWQPTLWLPTTQKDTGAGQAKQALDAGVSHLIVAGGDGTLRPVFDVIANTDLALGLVPMGTGNILARNLGLPLLPLVPIVRRAILGEVQILDGAIAELTRSNGQVESHFFTVMSGIGLDATIIQNADP